MGNEFREIYLAGMIDADQTCFLLRQMFEYAERDPRPLRVWICSEGGDVGSALAVHDALARSGATAVATGMCMSAAVIALLGAGRRLATPNTMFALHHIQMTDGFDFPPGYAAVERMEKFLVNGLCHVGFAVESAATQPDRKLLLSAEDAVELKLIDGIIG